MPVAKPVTLRVARAEKVIGMPLTQQRVADALRGLGLPVTEGEGTVTVQPPSFRFDLQIEEDLIEEVARMVGYNNLPTTPPLAPITASVCQEAPCAISWRLWVTKKPSTTALWMSAGSTSWQAMPTPSSCSTPSPAK
jgi:phenylalanyl-tRNA synthetase beta subunit